MWEQEKVHLELFENYVKDRRVRPTVLMPFWSIAGYVLGAGSALFGKEAAMACTVAVEEVIGEHYNNQLRELLDAQVDDKELMESISKCRDDEMEHHDTGLAYDATQAPAYEFMSQVIKTGCRTAIWLSERI
jgi:ubiquinone biosynthesis monooxygenase Coq7